MLCPVLFSDQESSGRAAEGATATSRAPLHVQICRPYALHTIVLRDLYDFLDVINFAQPVTAMGTPSSARRTFNVRFREMH
jgi:hypothetical protein